MKIDNLSIKILKYTLLLLNIKKKPYINYICNTMLVNLK